MFSQLVVGAVASLFNFGIHAIMTVAVVMIVSRVSRRTSALHLFGRVTALLAVTMLALMGAHVLEVSAWAVTYELAGIRVQTANSFEFAFENYTAIGYGDSLPSEGRLIGAMTALNGLLLIGWSVAIIFEVMRMAECRFERPLERKINAKRKR